MNIFIVMEQYSLFNGGNNNYTNIIQGSINKENYMKSRNFIGINNGIAFLVTK